MEERKSAEHFLELIKRSKRGRFKLYIGMSAGVGKTYRMLQDAHSLLHGGIDVRIGYIETHHRKQTHELLRGIPLIPRRSLFYRGKQLEELDLDAVLNIHPEIVIIDELAHSNIEGSKNTKRWQDVLDILDAGINVISAVNIQHIESLNEEVKRITGIEVKERVPDSVVEAADEVVNIDLTAEELIARLKDGKIYDSAKIQWALQHFFKSEHILQLRELALKEVVAQVQRKVEREIQPQRQVRQERFLACISTDEIKAKNVIRKTARLAGYYNSHWCVLYVQTPREHGNKIALNKQRHLINNFRLATELGGEIIKVEARNIANEILSLCEMRKITTVCIGKPRLSLLRILHARDTFRRLLTQLAAQDIDLIILS
jgi:two-component system, OmpR family, sensor histidine kinase KdpD